MIYTTDHIKFEKLTPNEFERLCFELLLKYGYTELTWRQGGADNGRDIEGLLNFSTQIIEKRTKWFFECKHYTNSGVPPAHLNSKIAWADSEKPSFLVLLISSYITTASRTWLEGIKSQKSYDIIIIEGDDLKNRLIKFPDLVERFFAANRYEQLLLDTKNYWLQYKIDPSYEAIKEITENIDVSKLDLSDIGFILMNFHKNYNHFESRNEYYGDFTDEVLSPLFEQLKKLSNPKTLNGFAKYKDDYSYLTGIGLIDDAEDEELTNVSFQHYTIHLNESKREKWAIGHYLFIKTDMGDAFELFSVENSDFTTSCRLFQNISKESLNELAIDISESVGQKILEFAPKLFAEKIK